MAKESFTTLDRMQRADHDTLIRVEGKVDGIVTDVKDMKDGVNTKLLDHEARVKILEQQSHDFKTIWKFVVALATTIGTVLGFTLSLAANSLRLFRQ